jgi:hypothetical protein
VAAAVANRLEMDVRKIAGELNMRKRYIVARVKALKTTEKRILLEDQRAPNNAQGRTNFGRKR